VSRRHSARPIRNGDPDLLHHALVLVVEDVTVQDELADVALVTSSAVSSAVCWRQTTWQGSEPSAPDVRDVSLAGRSISALMTSPHIAGRGTFEAVRV
jgi:hypothetical protein